MFNKIFGKIALLSVMALGFIALSAPTTFAAGDTQTKPAVKQPDTKTKKTVSTSKTKHKKKRRRRHTGKSTANSPKKS
jgi:hypothetical protein